MRKKAFRLTKYGRRIKREFEAFAPDKQKYIMSNYYYYMYQKAAAWQIVRRFLEAESDVLLWDPCGIETLYFMYFNMMMLALCAEEIFEFEMDEENLHRYKWQKGFKVDVSREMEAFSNQQLTNALPLLAGRHVHFTCLLAKEYTRDPHGKLDPGAPYAGPATSEEELEKVRSSRRWRPQPMHLSRQPEPGRHKIEGIASWTGRPPDEVRAEQLHDLSRRYPLRDCSDYSLRAEARALSSGQDGLWYATTAQPWGTPIRLRSNVEIIDLTYDST